MIWIEFNRVQSSCLAGAILASTNETCKNILIKAWLLSTMSLIDVIFNMAIVIIYYVRNGKNARTGI